MIKKRLHDHKATALRALHTLSRLVGARRHPDRNGQIVDLSTQGVSHLIVRGMLDS